MTGMREFFVRLAGNAASINIIGLSAAALIPVAALPLVSRIYEPSTYGKFAIAFAFAAMASTLITGRFEAAIVVPEDDRQGLSLAWLATLCATKICVAALVIVTLTLYLKLWPSGGELYLLAVGAALFAALTQVAANLAIRFRSFGTLAVARVCGALCQVTFVLGLGLAGYGAPGLMAGFIAGYCVVVLVVGLRLKEPIVRNAPQKEGLVFAAKQHWRYPVMNMPSTAANTVATQLPLIWVGTFFGAQAAGQLGMLLRVWAGSAIVTKGVGEVFRIEAAREKGVTGRFPKSFRRAVAPMAVIALIVCAVLMTAGPMIFSSILGTAWAPAGHIGATLAPFLCMQMIATTTSFSYLAGNRLGLLMTWQFGLLLALLAGLAVAQNFVGTPEAIYKTLSTIGLLMYAFYLFGAYKIAQGPGSTTEIGQ